MSLRSAGLGGRLLAAACLYICRKYHSPEILGKALLLFCFFSSTLAACPPGTVYGSLFSKCYKYVAEAASYWKAEKSCNSLGGSLVSLSSSFENAYISGIASATTSSSDFWIGVNLLVSAEWSWTAEEVCSYGNWAPGQTADSGAKQCGSFQIQDNFWTKELCSTAKPYMCQIDPNSAAVPNSVLASGCTTSSTPTTPSTGACPYGRCPSSMYTLNPDTCKCYRHYQGLTTNYNQSEQVCAREGGTMAVIASQADNTFIANFARNKSEDTNPWIGLWCYSNVPSSCRWIDGSPMYFSNFASGYPRPNQPAYLDVINQRWYTFDSSSTGTYICQQNGIRSAEEPQLFQKGALPAKAMKVRG